MNKKKLHSKKRILITGGAGFIGSHLCQKFLSDGHDVICLDNFFSAEKRNVTHLIDNPSFELIRWDVTSRIELEVDEIYNLACPASPIHYQLDPVKTIKTNVMGAINMLELAERLNAKIFQASTSEVYGDPEQHPQTESYWGHVNSFGPRSCYDEGKRCVEALFHDFNQQHGVDIRVARIFNTYGPRMHHNDGRVVSNFITQALLGEPITIFGDGSQTRSFCYITDMVEGICKFMETNANVSTPVNLGNPEEHSMSDLAELVIRMTGSKSQLSFQPLPNDDPRQRQPDISLAKEIMDWTPSTKLIDGLQKTIDYFKSELKV